MFINSDWVDIDDECAELFSKCEMSALLNFKLQNCKMSEKGVLCIFKTKCEKLKSFRCNFVLNQMMENTFVCPIGKV